MKITDLLKKQSICLDGKADSKEQVIREMVDLMAEGGTSMTLTPIVKPSLNEKKKELQELVKALQSRMARLKR